ncbi:MAG: SufD family Fe-S cluster assembly protein [Pseudomonadota bacterium]
MADAARQDSAADALFSRHPAPPVGSGWAAAARAAARDRFNAMGAPRPRDEYWKYTKPGPLTDPNAPSAAVLQIEEAPVFDTVDRIKLVFVDGVFAPELSDDPVEEGLEVLHLPDALATDIHWARDLYGTLEAAGQSPVARPLAALNTALAPAGLVIRATAPVARPVSMIYHHHDTQSDAILHHVIRVEPGAALTVLENGPAAARFNKCMEIDVADRGVFNHVRTQGRDHERLAATHMFARLGTESSYKSFTLTVNGVLTRNEHVITLTGDNTKAHVAGAAAGDGRFHHDDTVFITHDAVNCESRQVFKKVLRNGAVGAFQGKILVEPDAQKTDGYQISQGLLLDEDSQFLAKPELEIYADDVACSHGSTVGAVDDDALFYLTSRGVPKREAQDMLVLAFMDEAIQEIEDEALADAVRERLAAWLARRRG